MGQIHISELEKLRLNRRWSLRQMEEAARSVGFPISARTIRNVELGVSGDTIRNLTAVAIAKALNTTGDDTFTPERVIELYQEEVQQNRKTA